MIRHLFIICCVGVLVACQSGTQIPQPIRFAVAQAPINLDPRYATDAASERANRLLYQRLVEFDASAKPIAGIASWHAESPLRYRFTLKEGLAPFHNGHVVSAADVKATYDSFAQLKDAPHAAEFANISRITVLNERTLFMDLKVPDAHFPAKLIIGILPQPLIEKHHDFAHHPVGSGVFQFSSWQDKLMLKRVADGQLVSLGEVKDPTVRVLKLLRGEADLLQGDLPPELVKYLQTKPEVTVQSVVGANFSYLGLNMQDPVLQQLKVRQALTYAIDRQAIINSVMVRQTRLAGTILPPEHYSNAALGIATLTSYRYNPVRAKQLLQEAGISLPLKLVYKTSTDAQRVRFATILQAQMAPAGIDLEIRSLDWGTFFEDVKQGQFQLFGLTWVGIKTPEIYAKAFGSNFVPPKGFNRGRYKDAVLDDLIAKENWPAVTMRIHQQLPYIPLWYEGQFAATRNTITHYVPQADGNWDGLAQIQRVHQKTL